MSGFYYIDDASKQQCGPFSPSDLQSKNIRPETMVWRSGMTDWMEAKNVSELAHLFNPNAQPVSNVQDTSYSPTGAGNTTYNQTQYNSGQPYNQQQYGQQQPYNQQHYNQNTYNNANNWNNGINDVRPMPKNWLVESILVTVLCCLPFGIAGIMSATKVESLYHAGDYDAAEQASKDAKKWTLVGFFSTLVGLVLYFLFFVVLGFASAY